jgi:hypothetical protein
MSKRRCWQEGCVDEVRFRVRRELWRHDGKWTCRPHLSECVLAFGDFGAAKVVVELCLACLGAT